MSENNLNGGVLEAAVIDAQIFHEVLILATSNENITTLWLPSSGRTALAYRLQNKIGIPQSFLTKFNKIIFIPCDALLDLKTFEDFGLRGLSVITALTAQNQKRVNAVFPVPARFVVKQIETLVEEYRIDVVKLGMLATGDIVLALARLFKKAKFKKIVIDPVFVSSSGYPLLDKKGIILLKDQLLPFATIVTPNLDEAAILSSMKNVSSLEEMKEAAIKIKKLGPKFVLVKGGHLKTVNSEQLTVNGKKAVDILYDGKRFKTFSAPRINKDIHGTGCILSSAIAAGMAKGMNVENAVREAKVYTTRIINPHTKDFGVGVNRETI